MIFFVVFFFGIVLLNGCNTSIGLIGILGSDRRSEKSVPAELDLEGDYKGRTILVLVEQHSLLGSRENLRLLVTDAVNETLQRKLKILSELIIKYRQLSDFRSRRDDFSLLSPAQVGWETGADMVLFISLQSYQLESIEELSYYKGLLRAEASLWEVSTEQKLWPDSEKSRGIIVGFEAQKGPRDTAVKKLCLALAHCVTRYFYDCPVEKFRIAEDISVEGLKDWER